MKKFLLGSFLALGLLGLGFSSIAHADPASCQDAINQYNSAISSVSDHLRLYANCVSTSNGTDDCTLEFSQLQSAQSDFEDAVSSYTTECGN